MQSRTVTHKSSGTCSTSGGLHIRVRIRVQLPYGLASRRAQIGGALEVLLDHPNADLELLCDKGFEYWQRSSTPLHSAVERDHITTL